MRSLRTALTTFAGAALIGGLMGGTAMAAPNPSYCPNGESDCSLTLTKDQAVQCYIWWMNGGKEGKVQGPWFCYPQPGDPNYHPPK